jgi:ligand-binding sensor domain-containing protein
MRLWAIFAFLLLYQSSGVKGADFTTPIDIDFKPEAISKLLTQQTVEQIFQDSRGAIWFLTQEGLNQYNGLALENFRYSPTNQGSISTNYVSRIAEDSQGTLWISTIGGGLNRYSANNNTFHALYSTSEKTRSPLRNDIYTIYADKAGKIWLGYDNAFSAFDPITGEFKHFLPSQEGMPALGLVKRFSESSNGTIWAATQAGLLEIHPVTEKPFLHRHQEGNPNTIVSNEISSVLVDRHDRVWAVSRNSGVSVLSADRSETRHFRHVDSELTSLSSNQVNDIYEDDTGRMWLGTYDGLDMYVEESNDFLRFTRQNTELPSDIIVSIYQSREGKFWIGTFYGLASGTTNLFTKVDSVDGELSSNSVNAFSETSDGSLWVGTDDGLNRLKPGHKKFEWINESTYPSISSPDVMSLLAVGDILWVGTYAGGLNKLDIRTNQTTAYLHNNAVKDSLGAN